MKQNNNKKIINKYNQLKFQIINKLNNYKKLKKNQIKIKMKKTKIY